VRPPTDSSRSVPADGYALGLSGSSAAINANFNFIRDIAPVGGIERMPRVGQSRTAGIVATLGDRRSARRSRHDGARFLKNNPIQSRILPSPRVLSGTKAPPPSADLF
jgi:hypothetical protein